MSTRTPWSRARAARVAALGLALMVVGACTMRGAGGQGASDSTARAATTGSAPYLARLTPDTIALGKAAVPTLVLTGRGFVAGPSGMLAVGVNAVRIGRATFDGLPADSSGTILRFAMPLTYTDTSAKGRPSSFAPGQYPVSVVTPRGTSNTLTLTMIP